MEPESRTGVSRDNMSPAERWLSAFGGLALLLSATRGRNAVGRLALGAAGLSLMTRGATGYCAVKGAINGETTVGAGLKEQWRRLTQAAGAARQRIGRVSGARSLDSLEALYISELQELYSAESQFIALARELIRVIGNAQLAFRVEEYATELQARRGDIEELLAREGADRGDHPDDAMRALVQETQKMAQVCADNVRDAALASSVQRIIHYKIAGYGTIAAYAKALGRMNDAGRFAQLADRDRTIDAEITDIANGVLNPEAGVSPPGVKPSEVRTH